MKTRWQNQQGFTLIELMVIVLILGILAALALPAYSSMIRRARYAEIKKDMGTMAKEAQMYRVEFGQYPDDVMPRVQPNGISNWPQETPVQGFYDYDHWSIGKGQCYVQIAFVGEELKRRYKAHSLNASPGKFEEFDDNLVLGVDLYDCPGNSKGGINFANAQ